MGVLAGDKLGDTNEEVRANGCEPYKSMSPSYAVTSRKRAEAIGDPTIGRRLAGVVEQEVGLRKLSKFFLDDDAGNESARYVRTAEGELVCGVMVPVRVGDNAPKLPCEEGDDDIGLSVPKSSELRSIEYVSLASSMHM